MSTARAGSPTTTAYAGRPERGTRVMGCGSVVIRPPGGVGDAPGRYTDEPGGHPAGPAGHKTLRGRPFPRSSLPLGGPLSEGARSVLAADSGQRVRRVQPAGPAASGESA